MEDYGYSNYKLFLSGDLQGFENIVKYYRNNLILFIAQYAHDFQLAEDISQEVFVKLYLKKPNYAKQASFKTWLYTIAKRDAISYAKKHKLQLRANDNGSLGVEEEFLDIIIADERKKALHNALNELCDKYRNVLYLTYFEDFSVREISVLLKKTPKQVTDMLYNAKKALSVVILNGGEMYEILLSST